MTTDNGGTDGRLDIRPLPAEAPDETFLPFLDLCVNWSMDRPRIDPAEFAERADLAFYFRDWGREGDIAAAAHSGHDVIGLAWLRLGDSEGGGYGWVAADIPELSLAVLPEHQSQGIGAALLETVCALARMRGHTAVSLAVEDGNGAAHLYGQHGFFSVGRNGDSDLLVRRLEDPLH